MTTVLVTGGCGFIASHFIRLLLQETSYRVINLDAITYAGNMENLADVLSHPNHIFYRGDITDSQYVSTIFEAEKPSAVVNFAAESHVDRSIIDSSPFLKTNVLGTHVLLEVARQHKTSRFLQVSTDEVYGDAEGEAPRHEGDLLKPSSPYASSKASADLLCLSYNRTYEIPVIIVRSANNYGPFQFPEKLIPLMIRNALTNTPLPIYGDGLQQRDWLYVEDNVSAILSVLQSGRIGSIYNIGTGIDRTNLEVIHEICDLLAEEQGVNTEKFRALIEFTADRPGHDRRYALDTEHIRTELGWSPQVSFDNGLRDTIRWYLDNQSWIESVTSGKYTTYYENVYAEIKQDS
jgi:dTDP-glucose 4,6-dehydratase